MALQSSGPISFADINAEFARGAGTQLSMSQLYRNGGIVPDASVNAGIPTSGAIGLGQFYGATRRVPINITISANQTNYVLNTAKAAGYVAGVSDIVLTINSGIYVSANATNVYALDVDTSWSAGDTLKIVNNGFIVGMGGAGGNNAVGAAGGPAFIARRAVSIQNSGTIGGGGGGGGSGGNSTYQAYGGPSTAYGGRGGGGRTGTTNSAGGNVGTLSAPGAGVVGGKAGLMYGGGYISNGGTGGTGGQWGAGGATGTSGYGDPISNNTAGRAGGSGGVAVAGNANITWLATGTRLGALT